MEVPSYLLTTAYGQRLKRAANKRDGEGGYSDDRIGNTSGGSGNGGGGLKPTNGATPPPKRIFNKTTSRASANRQSPTIGGLHGSLLESTGGSRGGDNIIQSVPATPSTVPIFRDEGRITSPSGISSLITTIPAMHESDESHPELEMEISNKKNTNNASLSSKSGLVDVPLLLPSSEVVAELPRRWVKREVDHPVTVTKSGKVIEYKSDLKPSIQEVRALKTDYPIPGLCGVYYYEVEIVSCSRDPMIGIGFCTEEALLTKLPGMEQSSWGYHSDDGKTIACQTPGCGFGPVFGCGDIVGCGLDFTTKTIFYTKNGISLGPAFHEVEFRAAFSDSVRGVKAGDDFKYYPCIGFKPTVCLHANFGDHEFLYDINQYLQGKKTTILDTIKNSGLLPRIGGHSPRGGARGTESNSVSEMKPAEVPGLIQELIASYFSYLGYVDTGKAFQQELNNEKAAPKLSGTEVEEDDRMEDVGGVPGNGHHVESITESKCSSEDAEVLNRQRIGRFITEGDIDRAFKYLNLYYPQVLEEKDSLVVFKLECCKFIELVRATIPTTTTTTTITAITTDDVEMTDSADENASGQVPGSTALPFDRDTALSEAVAYGQTLRLRYKDDKRPFVRKRLSIVFSLLAYDDPREDESVAFLLNEDERYALSEEVNSRILVSLGKAPIPPLQRVAQHAMALVWELQNKDRLETNVLNIHQDFF